MRFVSLADTSRDPRIDPQGAGVSPYLEAAMATPLPLPVQRFEVTEVVPVDLSKGHVTWCSCGVIAGGARDPRPGCAMHSGETVGFIDADAYFRPAVTRPVHME